MCAMPTADVYDNIIGYQLLQLDASVFTVSRQTLGRFVVWTANKSGAPYCEFRISPGLDQPERPSLMSIPPASDELMPEFLALRASIENGINQWCDMERDRATHAGSAGQVEVDWRDWTVTAVDPITSASTFTHPTTGERVIAIPQSAPNARAPQPVVDPTDQLILAMVRKDPSMTDDEIGRKLPNGGLSRGRVNERRNKLEAMGYRVR
jgi:hypothetical protein